MMRKIAAMAATGALTLGLAAGAASAAPGGEKGKPEAKPNTACMQAGIGTLQSLGLLPAVAKNGIEVVDVGVVAFPDVLSLHRSNPELFSEGGVSVVVPGLGVVPATWCTGL